MNEPAKKRFTLIKKQDRVKAGENGEMQVPLEQVIQPFDPVRSKRKPRRKTPLEEAPNSRREKEMTEIRQLIAAVFITSQEKEMGPSELGTSIRQLHRKLVNLHLSPLPDLRIFKFFRGTDEFYFRHPGKDSLFCKIWRDVDDALSTSVWKYEEVERKDERAVDEDSLTVIYVPSEMLDACEAGTMEMIMKQIKSFQLEQDPASAASDGPVDVNILPESTCCDLYDYYNVNVRPLILTDTRSAFLSRLNEILNDGLKNIPYPPNTTGRAPSVTVHFFGSSINNLGFRTSDADLCIIPDNPNVPGHPYSNMNRVSKVLRKHYIKIQPINGARVPIVKFFDPATKLECDINFNHSLGVSNSALLASYTYVDPRVQPLIMMLKFFVKRRQINDASLDTISSYAYTLMVISFLQHRGFLPNLQKEFSGERQRVVVPDVNMKRRRRRGQQQQQSGLEEMRVVDVSFKSVERTVFEEGADWTSSTGVANLFIDFLDYFANKHTYKPHYACSVKDGGISVVPAMDKMLLVVLDPFEEERNCTRMVDRSGLNRVRFEFQQAIKLLQSGAVKKAFSKL